MKKSDIENGVTLMVMIDKLTRVEGSSVEIHHDNADFDGPECSVTYFWLDGIEHKEKQFFGPTVNECLHQAYKEALGADLDN